MARGGEGELLDQFAPCSILRASLFGCLPGMGARKALAGGLRPGAPPPSPRCAT